MWRSKQIKQIYQKRSIDYRYYGFAVLVLCIIGFLGALSLRETFSGDQALFLIYSQEIEKGAILYRDIWDIKQPAIFIFYLIAGKLFGFNEVGIHLFEILYWFSLALIMIFGLRNYFTKPLFAVLTPLFTIGIYYSVSGSWHLTQVESLVCFPLFMTLWFCQKFLENPNKKSLVFLSGICGGIVVLFKLLFIIILFFFWFFFLIYCYSLLFRTDKKQRLVINGLITLGFLTPIVLVIFYFANNDSLSILWYSTFVYPYGAAFSVTEGDRSQVFKDGIVWFFKFYFPIIALTIIFLLLKIKSLFTGWLKEKRFDLNPQSFLFLGLIIWTFSGFAVILIQPFSWWEYHYSLLMLPLGILAVKGLEELFEKLKNKSSFIWKTSTVVIIMLLFIPTARRLAHKTTQYSQVTTVKIGQKELRITGSNIENYNLITAETKFLTAENQRSRIFVISDPLYYYLSNSTPAISSNGWMPNLFTDVEWRKLNYEMQAQKPEYVFVEKSLIQLIQGKNPEFLNTLYNNYTIYSTSDKGLFFKLNEL